MDIPLSFEDIKKIVGYNINCLAYNELENYNNIFDVLGDNLCCMVLYNYDEVNNSQYGHWCCVFMRNEDGKDILEFFDSYGNEIDSIQMDEIKDYFKKKQYKLFPWLSKLMIDSGLDLHYNNYRMQSDDPNIATCGRWCSLRILTRENNIDKFYKYYSQFPNMDLQSCIDTDSIAIWGNIFR